MFARGFIPAPTNCRPFGPRKYFLRCIPRPSGRGYWTAALRACVALRIWIREWKM